MKNYGELTGNGLMVFSTVQIQLLRKPYLIKCKICKSGLIQNSLSKSDAERLYTLGDGTKRWTGAKFIEDKTIELVNYLEGVVKAQGKVCDVGCNTGEFLSFAKSLGAETYGVELSEASVNVARSCGHYVESTLRNFDVLFDLVTAFDLIEHLYDPYEFIDQAFTRLKAGGILILLTGNINSFSALVSKNRWWYINYPEHVMFPSKKFYSSLKNFELISYTKTYASNSHRKMGKSFINIIRLFFDYRFNGRPSFYPDHHLIVLKKLG